MIDQWEGMPQPVKEAMVADKTIRAPVLDGLAAALEIGVNGTLYVYLPSTGVVYRFEPSSAQVVA